MSFQNYRNHEGNSSRISQPEIPHIVIPGCIFIHTDTTNQLLLSDSGKAQPDPQPDCPGRHTGRCVWRQPARSRQGPLTSLTFIFHWISFILVLLKATLNCVHFCSHFKCFLKRRWGKLNTPPST